MILGKLIIPAGTTLKDSLLACWEFDNSGNSVPDANGASALALSSTGAVQQSGKINYSNYFSSASYYATLSSGNFTNAIQNINRTFSINVWAKCGTLSSGADGPVFAFGTYGSTNQVVIKFYNYSGYNKLNFITYTASKTGGGNDLTGNVSSGTWYMVTMVFDGNTCYAYRNGTLVNTFSIPGTGSLQPQSDIYLGVNPSLSYSLKGYIDQTAWWNKALSGNEISQLYNSGNGLAFINW